jgi:putative ABC transport system substrate-binding protein
VAVWPVVAGAQRSVNQSRIGMLIPFTVGDPETKSRVEAFLHSLEKLGYRDGDNAQFVYRWGAGETKLHNRHATELVASSPEVILGTTEPALAALLQVTRDVPIVFVQVVDPFGAGFVAS